MNNISRPYNYSEQKEQNLSVSKTFLSGVFSWMFFALAITASVAYVFSITPSLINLLYNYEGGMTTLGWIVMLAPFGLVLLLSAGYKRLSAPAMVAVFILYSVLMGASLSFIFLAYTDASIAKTFVITSATFGVMAFVGYTTKTDLGKFGSIMFMGLIGIIIASVVNIFMRSGTMDYIISFLGVLIFTGLTAYDVQKLKRIGASIDS